MYLKDGYCPAEFMQHCYDMLLKRTEISSRAYSYRCEDHGIYYLSSPIVINNCAHGYIFMLSWEENNSPKAHETVQLISRVAADFIRRNEPEQSSSAQLYRRLLTDILGGESRNAIAERITACYAGTPLLLRRRKRDAEKPWRSAWSRILLPSSHTVQAQHTHGCP